MTRVSASLPAAVRGSARAVISPGATIVCTVGMHRSGTSLVSRMLNLLGVALGPPESVVRFGFDNPTGYWEHFPLQTVNEEILTRFGGSWCLPPDLPPQWWRDGRLDDLRHEAIRVMAADFVAAPLWGWKDPRTCLTLPFWQDLLGEMRYVVCVRSPRDVVASLQRRDRLDPERAERLWLRHIHDGLAATQGATRLFVFYEDVLADWRRELRRLAAFIGRPGEADSQTVQDAVASLVDVSLCHHRGGTDALLADDHISYAAKTLYLSLRSCAATAPLHVSSASGRSGDHPSGAGLTRLAAEAVDSWRQKDALAAEREANAAERAAHAAELERQAKALDTATRRLVEIRDSSGWKAITASRRLLATLLPPGTRRRRFFDAAVRRAARHAPPSPPIVPERHTF